MAKSGGDAASARGRLAGFSHAGIVVATTKAAPRLWPGTISFGQFRGIAVGLHYSWFLIAALISFSLAGHFGQTHPDWSMARVWGVALITAALFFATLLAHELSHALVAQFHGLPVRSITLFALGGMASIEREANSAKTEFLVAIVGPIVSFVIGLASIAAAWSLGWSYQNGAGMVGSILGWLGSINVLLALFNLIPGYPLDGGRVLRSALWAMYKDADRATRHAARVGQAVGGVFIAWGLVQFVLYAAFGGLWLAAIGWFLMMAAEASYAEVTLGQALHDVRVADVMGDDCLSVEPGMDVGYLVDHVLLRTGRRCVVVKRDDRVLGLVTAHDVRAIDRARWPDTTVADVMRPIDQVMTVSPAAPLSEALRAMARADVNQLPVVADGRLEGIVSRAHILQLLESRSDLRAA
jgi:Zn-dependent protease/predicted transcriptional regulator